MTKSILDKVANRTRAGKTLVVGATNIDHGVLRTFDVGIEARAGKLDRFRKILLASASIPGVFPPVEIDGDLYVDGGRLVAWVYRPGGGQEPALQMSFGGYRRYGPVLLSTRRSSIDGTTDVVLEDLRAVRR